MSEWQPIETAPRRGHVLLLLGDSIPDVPDVRVGSFISELDAAEIGEELSASGGWLVWNSGDDWFVLSFADVHGWCELPTGEPS